MIVSAGLCEARQALEVELLGGDFHDSSGRKFHPGRHRFEAEIVLNPGDAEACAFALDGISIGIGFHWERKQRQVFRGALRLIRREGGLTAINDVALEDYVTSVISSEMSATCPVELLKAHAVISRSWLWYPKSNQSAIDSGYGEKFESHEICRWYGREAHRDFDVCADDHCQRYQGISKAFTPAAAEAVRATAGEFLRFRGAICDARFSKSCGGRTERYATAWEDKNIAYLESVYDGPGGPDSIDPESWIRSTPRAYCDTDDARLLGRILPGFDQETRDFYRWRVEYAPDELGALVRSKLGVNLGSIQDLQPLARGPSGRIFRLKISGESDYLIIGKELEIRRALSPSHLYSSAFVVDREMGKIILKGAGWGHGVGLCQIGAAVMADRGKSYREILAHYYRGATAAA